MAASLDRLSLALSDRYRIERELGAGGMAAQDLKHDRRVAIKVLKPELAAVIGAGRFLRDQDHRQPAAPAYPAAPRFGPSSCARLIK